MYVKDHMTREPVTITKDVKISKAVDIMSKGHFHRLPQTRRPCPFMSLIIS